MKNVIGDRSVNPSEVTQGEICQMGSEEGTGRGRDIEDEVKPFVEKTQKLHGGGQGRKYPSFLLGPVCRFNRKLIN